MVKASELCKWIKICNKFSVKPCNNSQDNEKAEELCGEEARDMEDINVLKTTCECQADLFKKLTFPKRMNV